MSIRIIIISYLLVFTFQCKCPTTARTPPKAVASDPAFAIQDETINGINHGKPIVWGDLIFLIPNFPYTVRPSAVTPSCPIGYRLPSVEEYTKLLEDLGGNAFTELTKADGLNLTPSTSYITRSKVYPTYINQSDSQSWHYYALTITASEATVSELFWYNNTAAQARCVKHSTEAPEIKFPNTSVIKGVESTIKINSLNWKGILWQVNDFYYQSEHLTIEFPEYGCYLIEAWTVNIADETAYSCKELFVGDKTHFDVDTRFKAENQVVTISTGVNPKSSTTIFSTRANAPLSPKNGGGFYIAYTIGAENGTVHILEYSVSYTVVADTDTGLIGHALDIAATPWGYTLLLSNSGTWVLHGYNEDHTPRFQRIIMENSGNIKSKESVCVYDTLGVILHGTEAMFSPWYGRILYGNGILGVSFSHKNNIENGFDINAKTGDSFYTFDENGNNVKIALNFTSQSLIHSMLFDGTFFLYAGLGGSSSKNINACFIDPSNTLGGYDYYNKRNNRIFAWCKPDMHPEGIPGEIGNSCGRFGGVFYDEYYYKFGIVYAVKPCSIDTNLNNDEVGLIMFNFRGDEIAGTTKHVIRGISAVEMVNLRAGKYGNNIWINYIVKKGETSVNDWNAYENIGFEYDMFYVLVGTDGRIINGPIKSTKYTMSVSDDIRILSNGAVAWTSIDNTGEMSVNYMELVGP